MSNRGVSAFVWVAMVLATLLFCVHPAFAQTTTPPTTATPATTAQQQAVQTACSAYVGVTNHIVGCIRTTLDSAATVYFTAIYPIVSRAIGAAMTLAVILFGCMAALGVLEKVGRDSVMLIIKVAAVGYFSMNSDYMYTQVIGMMDGTAQAVVSFVPTNGQADNSGTTFDQLTCLQVMVTAQGQADQSKAPAGPWMGVDCLLDTVIGIKMDPEDALGTADVNGGDPSNTAVVTVKGAYNDALKGTDKGLSRGLLYLLFSSYQSSVIGVILALIGFLFIWGIVVMAIKAMFVYIAGYLGIALMMMLAPIFVPMVLFSTTREYFDKWIKLIISFALQPIIILVFISFSIAAVDLAIFSGNYSIMYRIAGDASRVKGFSLNDYLTKAVPGKAADGTAITKAPISNTEHDVAQVKADVYHAIPVLNTQVEGIAGIAESSCNATQEAKDPNLKNLCSEDYPWKYYSQSLDWEQLAAARTPAVEINTDASCKPSCTPGQSLSREVLAAAIFAGIVVFVMNQLMKVVPLVAYDLFGDYGQSPYLGSLANKLPGMQNVKKGMQEMVTRRGGVGS